MLSCNKTYLGSLTEKATIKEGIKYIIEVQSKGFQLPTGQNFRSFLKLTNEVYKNHGGHIV